jgi:hypothetical protein
MLLDRYLANDTISEAELNAILERYPWFSAAQVLKARFKGVKMRYDIDAEKIAEESEGEIISRFLRKGEYRIVADDSESDVDICTEAEIDDEDDIVSEELAEIYLLQGLKCQAIEIYRKLSLLNSEKSAYFAEKIENIEKNN